MGIDSGALKGKDEGGGWVDSGPKQTEYSWG